MTDRIAMVGEGGTIPDDILPPTPAPTSVANGDSTIAIAATDEITVTSVPNAASDVWDARRSYGITDKTATEVPVIFHGGIETDGMIVALGPKLNRTWESHCLHAWDETATWRVTLGIDENDDPSIGFLQVWNPGTASFGKIQIGSDYSGQGTFFGDYDITSYASTIRLGGTPDVTISRNATGSSLTIRGGTDGNPTKGSFLQLRGGAAATNPAGTVVNFGCTWLSDASLTGTALTFNFVSSTKNVDYAKITSTGQFEITTGDLRITTPKTPTSATDTGSAGEVCWDTDYVYVCTATDTWKRAALSTWP